MSAKQIKQAAVKPIPRTSVSGSTFPVRRSTKKDELDYLRNLSRTLHVSNSSKGDLPQLTFSNELDVKLYALFSLLVKNFVQTWYVGLGFDKEEEFIGELVFLFSHVCRKIQERISSRRDEIVTSLFVDLPYVLEKHFRSVYESMRDCEEDESWGDVWMRKFSDGLIEEEMVDYRRILVDEIVKVLFPDEAVQSGITRRFLDGLIEGVILRNVIENFSEPFVIWEILGKISIKMQECGKGTTNEDEAEHATEQDHTQGKKTEQEHVLSIFQVTLQLLMRITITRKFVNGCLKRLIFAIVNEECIGSLVDSMRGMMFPRDEYFEMKPRYVPTSEKELEKVYQENLKLITEWLTNGGFSSSVIFGRSGAVYEKAHKVMETFRHREVNLVLLQRVVDLLVLMLLPELA
ncbi:hypothetical protein JL09_g3563 [Pichia kudriavzevii]|uniref:PXA domain-containing protein n=1 Tax=Pichia kudriavzevii TaxID=4909 RepID=A0A099NWT0_PICKU|nr:hypothetical protein JL09_g3563 [Pichia kudriavzevii]